MFAPAVTARAQEVDPLREHYHRGVAFYSAKKYADAIIEFRAVVDGSASPNAQLMIARCYRELGQLPESVAAYERTIVLAGHKVSEREKYATAKRSAQLELGEVAKKIGRIRIEGHEPGMSVRINGKPVDTDRLIHSIAVTPGTVIVDVSKPGHEPWRETQTVGAAQEVVLQIRLTPLTPSANTTPVPGTNARTAPAEGPKRPGSPWTTWAWVAGGVGVVGLGAFTAFFLAATAQKDSLDNECVSKPCSTERRNELRNTGESLELWTNVSLAVGLAALAASVTLFVVGAEDDETSTGVTNAGIAVVPGGGGISLGGRF